MEMRMLLLLVMLKSVVAHPYLWTEGTDVVDPAGCDAHPTKRYAGHAAPQIDSTIVFALTDVTTGANVTSVCAGSSYNLQVKFSNPRESYITANVGTVFAAYSSNDPTNFFYSKTPAYNCVNRLVAVPRRQVVSNMLTMPCNVTGSLVVKVTSATGELGGYLTNTATIPVDRTCTASACASGNGTAASSNVSIPNTATGGGITSQTSGSADASTNTSATAPASPQAGLTCTPSPLGYSCVQPLGKVKVHFSVGGPIPKNLCTAALGGTVPAGASSDQLLHMTVEADIAGWIGLGFAQEANTMENADIIMGWSSDGAGAPFVNTYTITDSNVAPTDAREWALTKSVARSGPTLYACFTRRLVEPRAGFSATLDPTKDLVLNWALSSATGLVQHDSGMGGAMLNIQSGAFVEVADKTENRIKWHGALMSVSWMFLLPLGALMPRHRWVAGEARIMGVHVWFRLHLFTQCLGFALMTAGIAIAWRYFPDPQEGDTLWHGHEVLGTVVYACAVLQVVAGFFRPAPDAAKRWIFNLGHAWWGRITLAAAWANVYMGIVVYHRGIYAASLKPWIIPVTVVLGSVLVFDLLLTIIANLRVPTAEKDDHEIGLAMKQDGSSSDDSSTPRTNSAAPFSGVQAPSALLEARNKE